MAMLSSTIAEIILRGRNETGPAFAEVTAGLKAVQLEADTTGAAMARAGGSVNGASKGIAAATTGTVKALDAEMAATIKLADSHSAEAAKAEAAGKRAELSAQRQYVAVARAGEQEVAAAERAAAKQRAALQSVGKVAGLLTLGIAGVGYETTKMSGIFSRDMEMVRTQAHASQAEVDKMTPKLLTLAGPLGTAPDELAKSLYHVESAGFRGAKALDEVKLSAEGAKVGNADLEATTQAVIGVMSSGIKDIHNSTEAMSFLNATVGAGDMRMQQLDLAIATGVLPAFRNFGLGARDMGAALATLTDNVTPADEAATRLRMTVALLGAPSPKAITQLASIGIGATQLATDLRKPNGLLVAVTDLKKHLEDSGKSAVDQAALISRAFGGGRSSAAIETLLGEFDKFKSKYDAIDAGTKKWAKDWAETQKQAAFQAQQADASAKELGITLGTTLIPAAEGLLRVITPTVAGLARFSSEHKSITADAVMAAGAITGVVALVAAGSKLVETVGKIELAWKAVTTAATRAYIAENAAALGIAGVAAGAVVGISIFAQHKLDESNQSNQVKFLKEITKAYEDGKMSTAEYAKGLKSLSELTLDVKALTQAQIEGTKAGKEHAAAIDRLGRTSVDVANDFRDARLRIAETNREHLAAGAAVHSHQTELQKLDAEIKRVLASEIALTTEGLKKEESAFTSMADHAISEATRMKTGVEAQVKAMNVAITKSVSWTPIIQPQTIATTTAAPTQFATAGPTYNPKGAETLDPALGKDMGQLSSALDNLPPKFQDVWEAQIQKFRDEETNLYDKYLISLNKENQRDADAINKINADYHAKVNEASIKANEREAAENTRYLNALDSIEQAYNDRLTQINNKFLTDYQTAIVTYETALETSRQKAEADAQKHEDQQRLLAANEQAALAGIHGKNAAARRQAVIEEYARRMAADDVNYGHTVSANEAHVAGLSKTFDNHIKSLAAWANNQIASAHTNLVSHEHNLAKIHAEALAGLDKWLKGRDTKAQADRERALLKEAGIHIVDINGILTAFDKGGKIVGQQILAALGKLPDILKQSVFSNWATPQGNHTFLGPGTPIGSMPSQSLGGGAYSAPSLTQIATDSKNLPYVDPNSARETTLSAALVEFQHQSVLLGQQRDLNADQIKILQDKNRVDAGNAKLALDYLKYIAMQSDPKATQADKAAQLQLIKGDVNANVENAGELSSDIGKAVADAQQAVDAARQNVQAAQSAIVVGLLQEQVTELSDLTGIMQAEANIQTAVVNGQIAAINDQSAILQDDYGIEVANGEIMKASGEITKATDANSRALALAHMVVAQAQLKVAQDHLEIDKTKAQADVVAAGWAVKIAEAEAHMAKDKLAVDKANALANNAVADAHLKVAQQQLKIALDNAKLTADIAQNTGAIALEMGADPANIAADKAALEADTKPLQGLMNNESDAQQQAQQTAAQGAYTLGQDQAGITGLQISATSDSQNYALQLASLTAKEGKDNIDLQRAQAASAALTASNTTTANTLLQSANNALQERNDALTQLIGLMAQGVSWNGVGGDFKGILDQIGLQVHTNK